jgi:hypothetical protein
MWQRRRVPRFDQDYYARYLGYMWAFKAWGRITRSVNDDRRPDSLIPEKVVAKALAAAGKMPRRPTLFTCTACRSRSLLAH